MVMAVSAEVVSDPSGSPPSNATSIPVMAHGSLSLPVVTMSNTQSGVLPPGVLQYIPPPIQADSIFSIDKTPRYLSMLPSEVINAVFEYLKTSGQIRALTRVQQTSRLYYKMIRPIVWTEVHMSLFALNECWLSFNQRSPYDHPPPPLYNRPTWTDHGKESLPVNIPHQADEAHQLYMEGQDEAWHRLAGEIRLRYDLSHVKALVVVPMSRANALQYLTAVDIKDGRELPLWLLRHCKRDMESDTETLGIDEIRAIHAQTDHDENADDGTVVIGAERNVKPLLSTLAGEVRLGHPGDRRCQYRDPFSHLLSIHMLPETGHQTGLDYLDGPPLPSAYDTPMLDPEQHQSRDPRFVLAPLEAVLHAAPRECGLRICVAKSAENMSQSRQMMLRYVELLRRFSHRHVTIPSSFLEHVEPPACFEEVFHTSVDVLKPDKADRQAFVDELLAFFRFHLESLISGCVFRSWRSLSIRVIDEDETTLLGYRGFDQGYKPSDIRTQLEVRLHRMVDVIGHRDFTLWEKERRRKKRPIGMSEIELINLVRSRIQLDLRSVADINNIMLDASPSGEEHDDNSD